MKDVLLIQGRVTPTNYSLVMEFLTKDTPVVFNVTDAMALLGRTLYVLSEEQPTDIDTDFVWIELNKELKPILGLSQKDERWSDTVIANTPNKTIGTWGCLAVAYNMMAQYLQLTTLLPNDFISLMKTQGALSGSNIKPHALAITFPTKVLSKGWTVYNIFANIKTQIDKGIPVPARVDINPTQHYSQHWILVVGYTSDNDILIIDPNDKDPVSKPISKTIYNKIFEVLLYKTK